MRRGHVLHGAKQRRARRTTQATQAERAARIARMFRDKSLDELLALTPRTAGKELRQLGI